LQFVIHRFVVFVHESLPCSPLLSAESLRCGDGIGAIAQGDRAKGSQQHHHTPSRSVGTTQFIVADCAETVNVMRVASV
jgi:hypothetical protein